MEEVSGGSFLCERIVKKSQAGAPSPWGTHLIFSTLAHSHSLAIKSNRFSCGGLPSESLFRFLQTGAANTVAEEGHEGRPFGAIVQVLEQLLQIVQVRVARRVRQLVVVPVVPMH